MNDETMPAETSIAPSKDKIDPSISVVLPTLGRPMLQSVLDALADGETLPAALTIIDQGSLPVPEASLSVLARLGVKIHVVRIAPHSPANARNIGLASLATPYFAGLDEDCIPDRRWLKVLRAHLDAHPDAIITGRVSAQPNKLAPSTVDDEEPRIYTKPLYEDPLKTGNFAASRETAARIGPFDTRLNISAEDNDWGYRGLKMGIAIIYTPEARVVHDACGAPDQMAAVQRRYTIGQGMFFGKHAARGDFYLFRRALLATARHVWTWVRRSLLGPRDGAEAAAGLLLALLHGLAIGAFGLNRRQLQPMPASTKPDRSRVAI